MSFSRLGPTGSIVRGHVLDVSVRAITQALQSYDALLYVKWNPRKRKGMGTWEVRRRPEKNCIVDCFVWQGNTYSVLGKKETGLINHVLDAEYLDYRILDKIKSMDVWSINKNYFGEQVDKNFDAHIAKTKAKAREEMLYQAKQYKKEIREFKELIQSGFNPHRLVDYWEKKGS